MVSFRTLAAVVTPAAVACALLIGVAVAADKPDGAAAANAPAPAAGGSTKSLSIDTGTGTGTGTGDGKSLQLRGTDARQQLVVTAASDATPVRDVTRHVRYEVQPGGVIEVSKHGLVTALANGSAAITATIEGGPTATFPVTVERFGEVIPVNFANRVVPVFTKAGCNAGGCHGKASGQNGFKLSLLGFEPGEDYEHLVKEARGRRLFPAAPDRSLLLLKAIGAMPHGGGKRLEADSDDYRVIARWVGQGMPVGSPSDPTVARITVFPDRRVMARGGEQQLVVTAHYTDGSTEDVTRAALYEANDPEMAKVEGGGYVQVAQRPGDVGVMVRYQAKVAVFRATIPLGAPVDGRNFPEPKNFIDELVYKKLKDVGMPPSAVANDSMFIRRVTIDVAGRLPTPEETKAFLDDRDPAKRDKLIDRLVDSTDYADYFANKWSALLRNKRTQPTFARGTFAFRDWVRDSLLTNTPYDQFVRQVITASGDVEQNPTVGWYRQVKEPTAQLEDTAQLFLGMRLQCAQCHHHPFEKWSQQDYFSFQAFFSRVGRKPGVVQGEEVIFHKRGAPSATNPKTKQSVKPAGLGETPLDLAADEDPRIALADWMTRKDNPFFARSLANRYWKHFFGRGIVDPEDDMRETNPPTNPELLDALAKHFVDSGYDLKDLVRTICRSQAYQLDSLPNDHNGVDRQNFSRYYPRRLTAEVLLDAVNALTGTESKFEGLPPGTRAVQLPDNSFNAQNYFLTVFGRPDSSSSCECERSGDPSLAQSLHLLNAKDIQDRVGSPNGRAAKLAADKDRPDADKVRELYRLAYARDPDESELASATGYIEKVVTRDDEGGKGKEKKDPAARRKLAYEDLVWALMNTKEFAFNH